MLKMAMVMADFTGAEAEELRRALSFHRSEERMRKVSVKLRAAMERKGIPPIKSIEIIQVHQLVSRFTAFPNRTPSALPFWLMRSAYLKAHRAPEFYASLLNNQPMGFYSPATIVKDAQRHGLKIKPVCVSQSDWCCTVVDDDTVRLGLCVVNGLRQEHAEELVRQRQHRAFESLDDFKRRVPLAKDELRILAELGALNCFADHRRAAMWQVEETLHDDLLDRQMAGTPRRSVRLAQRADPAKSPLAPMSLPERVRADYETMNLTTGPHPMKLLRTNLPNIWRATDLVHAEHGSTVQIAGNVICRQRPGTAKGFVFISLEDETGVANAIVEPDMFERFRLVITEEAFLLIQGQVQNSDSVVLIKARDIRPLVHESLATASQSWGGLVGSESHDFH